MTLDKLIRYFCNTCVLQIPISNPSVESEVKVTSSTGFVGVSRIEISFTAMGDVTVSNLFVMACNFPGIARSTLSISLFF